MPPVRPMPPGRLRGGAGGRAGAVSRLSPCACSSADGRGDRRQNQARTSGTGPAREPDQAHGDAEGPLESRISPPSSSPTLGPESRRGSWGGSWSPRPGHDLHGEAGNLQSPSSKATKVEGQGRAGHLPRWAVGGNGRASRTSKGSRSRESGQATWESGAWSTEI